MFSVKTLVAKSEFCMAGRMSCLFSLGTKIDGEIKALLSGHLHMVLGTSSWWLAGVESLSRVGSLSRELDNSR